MPQQDKSRLSDGGDSPPPADSRAILLAQLERCRQMMWLEKDPVMLAAIRRLEAFYQSKLSELQQRETRKN